MNNNNIKVICSVFLALILLVPASALILTETEAQPQSQPQSKVFAVGNDMTVSELPLKATQSQNGRVTQVSNFVIEPRGVVQLTQGQNLIVFTGASDPITIDNVKVTNERGQTTRLPLLPLQLNTYSLAGLNTGVYILDVIVNNLQDNSKGVYETVLVILAPNQQPIQPATAINQIIVKVRTDTRIIFRDNGNGNGNNTKPTPTPKCSNEAGSANLGFPYQDRTQCEVEEWNNCKKIDDDKRSQRCHDLREIFSDDCEGFRNLEECNEWYSTPLPLPPVITPDENNTELDTDIDPLLDDNNTDISEEIETEETEEQEQEQPLDEEGGEQEQEGSSNSTGAGGA
jgi:hypothetical protein